MPNSKSRVTRRVRLRPQNPFDLIRLLARSQSDPRKAVAELVQNSLDAGAQRIEIEWFNEKGRRALRVWDDGSGVFPELEREEALQRIAKTIGHSHKRDLSPAERREQMVLGQYGIGLIGFWSVGESLDMKSRVEDGRAFVLRMREDQESGEVFASRVRKLDEASTYTEITIRGVHEGALSKIRPPRLQAFLAHELRGQLLERGAIVRIRDRVSRGRARKEFVVEPRPYLGQPLQKWSELEVPGFESARLELYLVSLDEGRSGIVSLSCGGTIVLDNIAEIDGIDEPRSPWCDGRFEGVIDFPELYVSPGTRRGFAHDEPVTALLAALSGLELELSALLEEETLKRAERKRVSVAREIRRAFRSVARLLPEYDLFAVRPGGNERPGGAKDARHSGASINASPASIADESCEAQPPGAPPGTEAVPAATDDGHLFPAGPLAALELRPRSLRLSPSATRTARARPLDEDGRPVDDPVELNWRLEGVGELEVADRRVVYRAPDASELGEEPPPTRIHATANQGENYRASASISVQFTLTDDSAAGASGIPEPYPVTAPGEPWRSRVVNERWEINEAHRDYLAVCDSQSGRLRYLIHLFAKEVVLRNFGRPGDAPALERMVEVLTYLDRRGGRGLE